MKQKSGFLAFLLSAVLLWLLSRIGWFGITFGGRTWVTILIVALVLGIVNFIVVAIVRSIFKKGSPLFMFVIALLADAFALWLTARLVTNFNISFFPQAIIVAAILALACSAAGLVKD